MADCPICHEPITIGEGTYMWGRRIHRKCATLANMRRFEFLAFKVKP